MSKSDQALEDLRKTVASKLDRSFERVLQLPLERKELLLFENLRIAALFRSAHLEFIVGSRLGWNSERAQSLLKTAQACAQACQSFADAFENKCQPPNKTKA